MGERLNVVDCSGLTDADWAAVNRVNRACELGGAVAFWKELEKFDDVPLQLRVLGAFFPELVREVIEEEMTEHGLTADDWQEAGRKAESPLAINRLSKFSGLFLFGWWPISGEWYCVTLAAWLCRSYATSSHGRFAEESGSSFGSSRENQRACSYYRPPHR